MKLKYVDSIHAYYLDGKRCKGISTCAKIPDDTWTLEQWQKRQVAIGLARDNELLEAVRAAGDDKDKLEPLVEAALRTAGAFDAAEAGTATHDLTERHDKGQIDESTPLLPHEKESLLKWDAVLAKAGFRRIPGLTEKVVVYPKERICGRFDRLVVREVDERIVAIDLKTGIGAVRYPHATVAQLAMYANAPYLADFGAEGAEVTDKHEITETFVPMPDEVDRSVGYVISMPADEPWATVYAVNLKLGWKAVEQIIFPTLRWRAVDHSKLIKQVA